MNTAVAGFLGALIGAGASLLGLVIQQHYQTKRERMKIAADLGLSEYQSGLELVFKRGGTLPPVSAFILFHARLLEEMSKGKIDVEKMKKLGNEHDALMAAFKKTTS
jgi:hypothetical protein